MREEMRWDEMKRGFGRGGKNEKSIVRIEMGSDRIRSDQLPVGRSRSARQLTNQATNLFFIKSED